MTFKTSVLTRRAGGSLALRHTPATKGPRLRGQERTGLRSVAASRGPARKRSVAGRRGAPLDLFLGHFRTQGAPCPIPSMFRSVLFLSAHR